MLPNTWSYLSKVYPLQPGISYKNIFTPLPHHSPHIISSYHPHMSVSPSYIIAYYPCVCAQDCLDKTVHCYPTSFIHCLLFAPSSFQLFITTFIPSSLQTFLEACSDFSVNKMAPGQSAPWCVCGFVFLLIFVSNYMHKEDKLTGSGINMYSIKILKIVCTAAR